jgi:hypothetical protein
VAGLLTRSARGRSAVLLGAAGGLAKLEQLIARGLLMPKETLGCP